MALRGRACGRTGLSGGFVAPADETHLLGDNRAVSRRPSRWLAAVAPPLPVHAADAAACDSLDTARWMLGTWVADDGENSVIEEWRSLGSGTFEGSGRTVSRKTGAVVSSESLRLVAMSSAVYYIAKVSHNAYPRGICPHGLRGRAAGVRESRA